MWGAIASVAVPLLSGILGYKGQRDTNEANKAEAEANRQFQERMSSTAAQRSVADYKAAGLNPALAYDRSASSPSGNMATIGNAVERGASSAQQTASLIQQTKMAIEKQKYDIELTRSLAQKARVEAASNAQLTTEQIAQLRQQTQFGYINQPFDTRQKTAEAILRELLIPGAKNTASFEELIGAAGKGLGSAKTLAEIIKLLNPRDFRK